MTNDSRYIRGFELTTGAKLWELEDIPVHQTNGMGETLVVDSGSDALLIDSSTGRTREVPVPEPVHYWGWGSRMRTVWLELGDDDAESLWNPETGQVVEVPGADSVGIHDGDPSESTFLVTATRRDFTGEQDRSCWALSEAGALAGPYPAGDCYMHDGVLTSDRQYFPLPPGF